MGVACGQNRAVVLGDIILGLRAGHLEGIGIERGAATLRGADICSRAEDQNQRKQEYGGLHRSAVFKSAQIAFRCSQPLHRRQLNACMKIINYGISSSCADHGATGQASSITLP